jgi:ATP-binding protein involved in chromosome partitioning
MNIDDIKNTLLKVIYPDINKNIIELKVVSNVEFKKDNLKIELAINNEKAFENVKVQIKEVFKKQFKKIHIQRKEYQRKSMNYGNSANPNNRAPYAKNIIAVTSGKGGVGKTTVSVNLAIGLAQKGFKVGLLDADVYGPNVPRMLKVEDENLKWNDNNKIEPSFNYGIKIMSVGLTTPTKDTPLVWRSSVAISALIQFLEDVQWGELDFLVIDMPPGTGDVQLTMAQELPIKAGVIVTTPQTVSCDDVSRAVMMFKDIGVKIGGLVENMSFFIAPDTKNRYDIFGKDGGLNISKEYNIPFLGQIPLDMEYRENSDNGTPTIATSDEVKKEYYKNIVENLLNNIDYR